MCIRDSRRAVGQLYFKIEDAVTQRNDGGRGQINDRQHQHRLFAAGVKNLHAVGGDGFQHRDAGSESGKNSSDKEQDCLLYTSKTALTGAERIWFVMDCGSEIGNAAGYNRQLAAQKQLQYMGCLLYTSR